MNIVYIILLYKLDDCTPIYFILHCKLITKLKKSHQ